MVPTHLRQVCQHLVLLRRKVAGPEVHHAAASQGRLETMWSVMLFSMQRCECGAEVGEPQHEYTASHTHAQSSHVAAPFTSHRVPYRWP